MTGGKPRAEGPLALKRELRETQQKLEAVESELSQAEINVADARPKTSPSSPVGSTSKSEERRNAERESANQSAALRQMESEVQRLERRLQDWILQSERNKDARAAKQTFIEQKREEEQSLEHEQCSEIEVGLNEHATLRRRAALCP